jgi:hypothetical protein
LKGKPWTIDQERQLRQLLLEGKSFLEISRVMGKTCVSVKTKVYNLGLCSVQDVTSAKEPLASSSSSSSSSSSPPVASPTPTSVSAPESASKPAPRIVNVDGVDLKLPNRLPSVEEELKILSAAVAALTQPGLGRAEVSRLHNIIMGVKVYQEEFAKYVDYCGLENEVLELRKKLASEKGKGSS